MKAKSQENNKEKDDALFWKPFPCLVSFVLIRLLNVFGPTHVSWYFFQLLVANEMKENTSWYSYKNQSRLTGLMTPQTSAKLCHELGLITKENRRKVFSKEYGSNLYHIRPLPSTEAEAIKFFEKLAHRFIKAVNRRIENKDSNKSSAWKAKKDRFFVDIEYMSKVFNKQWISVCFLNTNVGDMSTKVAITNAKVPEQETKVGLQSTRNIDTGNIEEANKEDTPTRPLETLLNSISPAKRAKLNLTDASMVLLLILCVFLQRMRSNTACCLHG